MAILLLAWEAPVLPEFSSKSPPLKVAFGNVGSLQAIMREDIEDGPLLEFDGIRCGNFHMKFKQFDLRKHRKLSRSPNWVFYSVANEMWQILGDSFGFFRIHPVPGDWFIVLRCKAWILSSICPVCAFSWCEDAFLPVEKYHGFVISSKPTNWTPRKWQEWCTIALSQVFCKVASWAGRQVGSSAINLASLEPSLVG